MRRVAVWLGLITILSLTGRTYADLTISFESDKSVVAGSTATISLDVTLTGGPIESFNISALISGGTTTHLEFLSQAISGHGPTLDAATYVFAGNSAAQDPSFPSGFGTASGSPYKLQFSGGDSAGDFSNVTIGANNLLARLELSVPTTTSVSGSDVFTVSIDPNSTSFVDELGSPLLIDPGSRLSTTVTVTSSGGSTGGPIAVPELTTFVPALCGAVASLVFAGWRRLRART